MEIVLTGLRREASRPGEFGDDGGMVAGALGGAKLSVDSAGGASLGQRDGRHDVVEAPA